MDLSADTELTTALIARPLEWRVRIVEHVEVDTATSCRRRRSLQVVPLRTFLPQRASAVARAARHAFIVLNIASVPRGALLDFDVAGPGGAAAFLLPRAEIAHREMDYLVSVAGDAGSVVSNDVSRLLGGVLGYTASRWVFENAPRLPETAYDYLEDGFGQTIPRRVMSAWLEMDTEIAALVAPFAEAGRSASPTEHPVLGLPTLAQDLDPGAPDWYTVVGHVLEGYLALVAAARRESDSGGSPAAKELLSSLADYGRNYDVLVATKVPLDEPFMIKYSERRPLSISWRQNRAEQDLVISDALSNHVVLAVDDPNVRITSVRARTAGQDVDAFGAFTTRQSEQVHAVYAHDPDRDYKITLSFTLAPLRRLQYVGYAVAVLLGLLATAIVVEAPSTLRDVALVVGPSALAASVLLTREPSTLGSHLRRKSTTALIGGLVLVLAAGTASYLRPRVRSIVEVVEGLVSQAAGTLS